MIKLWINGIYQFFCKLLKILEETNSLFKYFFMIKFIKNCPNSSAVGFPIVYPKSERHRGIEFSKLLVGPSRRKVVALKVPIEQGILRITKFWAQFLNYWWHKPTDLLSNFKKIVDIFCQIECHFFLYVLTIQLLLRMF